jgi:hypothetical protein
MRRQLHLGCERIERQLRLRQQSCVRTWWAMSFSAWNHEANGGVEDLFRLAAAAKGGSQCEAE